MLSLFVGTESFNWTNTDFLNLASFCRNYGIDQVILKVYEITQGEWYQQLGGPKAIVQLLQNQGLLVLPYGYFYGNNPRTEGTEIRGLLDQFERFCIDIEGEFDGQPQKMKALLDVVGAFSGQLYVSTWANPITHNYIDVLALLEPLVTAWMPQAYDDTLVKEMYAQWPGSAKPIEPTFHIVNTPYVDAKSFNNFSLWEYQLAQQYIGLLQSYVRVEKGLPVATYPTNNAGMVINTCQVSQFQPGHSEFECGAFSVVIAAKSSPPDQSNPQLESDLIWWAEQEYAKTAGSNDPSNTAGASIADIHTMIKDTQTTVTPLNYWDTDISPTTTQDHDIQTIKAALQHGYPVIATVSEASIIDLDLGKNPYWWGPTGNHIIVWVGIAPDGNLLACDPANVIEGDGNLQTPKQVQTWPRRYSIQSVDDQWATIVRPPWLPSIPSGDPLSWPAYVPSPTPQPTPQPQPVPINQAVTVMYDQTSNQLIFSSNNSVVYRFNL